MYGIVAPIWNGERYLEKCIESVLSQTVQNFELVLVNDGSTDSSEEIIYKFIKLDKRIKYVKQDNLKVAKARNRGFQELSKYINYILFIDQDDYLEQNAIEILHGALLQHPESPASYGLGRFVGMNGEYYTKSISDAYGYNRYKIENNKRVIIRDHYTLSSFDVLAVWPAIMTPGQMLIKKEAFISTGGFDPYAEPADEWELTLKLSTISDLAYIPLFVMNKRCHDRHALTSGIYKNNNMIYIRKKMAQNNGIYANFNHTAKVALKYAILFNCNVFKTHIRQKNIKGARSRLKNIIQDIILYHTTYNNIH